MTREDRNKRRARIVRRWAAIRIGRAQREIWRKRRGDDDRDADVIDETNGAGDLLAELPETLVG